MKLKKLFKDIPNIEIKGSKECEVKGLSSDSRRVSPLDLFIAKKGESFDGGTFILDAAKAGAAAVLTDFYNPFLSGPVQVIAKEISRELEGEIARRFYDDPAKDLKMIGLTGTSGKTSISYITYHLLSLKGKSGLMGTIEVITGKNTLPSELTTPDCLTIYRYLKEMHKAGCTSAIMEVSSHALDQKRLAGITFDIALFSNLSLDHLDYHKTMESYFDAKAKLFTKEYLKEGAYAIFCMDCPYGQLLASQCKGPFITYGFSKEAMVRAENIALSDKGSHFTLWIEEQKEEVFLPLLGRHNILNALAAASIAYLSKLSLTEIGKTLATLPAIKGRMQRVEGSNIIIDYSHKPDALRRALLTLKEMGQRRIILVVGAGGDRDKEKRPMMGNIAATLADVIILTSDNPRSEDPKSIISEIEQGIPDNKLAHVMIEVDRFKAIETAICMAGEKDFVLISGKGHESRQVFRHTTIDFDDYKVAERIWEKVAISL